MMMLVFILLLSSFCKFINADLEISNVQAKIPVIYVMFGEISSYLKCNIELASRNNPVIILSSSTSSTTWLSPSTTTSDSSSSAFRHEVIIENFSKYFRDADSFSQIYKHFSKDHSSKRIDYELKCIQRWLILRDYMISKSLPIVFYGDSDTSVFTSMTEAWKERNHCAAMISIETQWHNYHWASAGHNSFWTLNAIGDFCEFFKIIYETPERIAQVLEPKWKNHGSTITDMSLLWLWWVAHKRQTEVGWQTGRPYSAPDDKVHETRTAADNAFNMAKQLNLPRVNMNLQICNALDVYNNTLFDHMHGWMGCGTNFNLDLESGIGHPNCIGISHHMGGVPRSKTKSEIKDLSGSEMNTKRLDMLTLHYQGGSKERLEYDVCRILLLTADKQIVNNEVKEICDKCINSHNASMSKNNRIIAGLPCAEHSSYRGVNSCF